MAQTAPGERSNGWRGNIKGEEQQKERIWGEEEEKEEEREGGVSYFFLLNRLKRFSLSLSRLPGLDSAVAEATVAGSV